VGQIRPSGALPHLPDAPHRAARRACQLNGFGSIKWVDNYCRWYNGGGPKRQALYMPALVAVRFNTELKAKYQAMTDAGKPLKVAIILQPSCASSSQSQMP